MFRLYNNAPTDFLIKMDAFGFVYSPIGELSAYNDCIFGSINEYDSSTGTFISSSNKIFATNTVSSTNYKPVMSSFINGIIGFNTNTVNLILSGFGLYNNTFIANELISDKIIKNLYEIGTDKRTLNYSLALVCKKLEIPFIDHPSIYSVNYIDRDKSYFSNVPLDKESTLNELKNSEKYSFVYPILPE
jgi:hypothetical protein